MMTTNTLGSYDRNKLGSLYSGYNNEEGEEFWGALRWREQMLTLLPASQPVEQNEDIVIWPRFFFASFVARNG